MATNRIIETTTGARFRFADARMARRYQVCVRVACPKPVDDGGAWFRSEKTGRTYLAASPGMRVVAEGRS